MRLFAIGIEHPHHVAVQGFHHPDLRHQGITARLQSSRASTAACHSGRPDTLFGKSVIYIAASLRVTSSRPSGRTMGSGKDVDQPLMAPALQVEHSTEAKRYPRGVSIVRHIAKLARHSGTAAIASVRAFPWSSQMVLTNPAGISAKDAFHGSPWPSDLIGRGVLFSSK
jgi:hypothetical protein